MKLLLLLACLEASGCDFSLNPRTQAFEWREGWVESPAGAYEWNGMEMIHR